MAGRQGLEPRYATPEAAVLPLDDLPTISVYQNQKKQARQQIIARQAPVSRRRSSPKAPPVTYDLEPNAKPCHAKNVPFRDQAIAELLVTVLLVAASNSLELHAQTGIPPTAPTQTSAAKRLQIESFETIWTTIRDKHWDSHPGGLDWDKIYAEYRPQIERAGSDDQARGIMRAMLARLKQTHFALLAPGLAEDIASDGGDATPGFEVRLLKEGVIVTETFPGSKVHAGWELLTAGRWDIPNLVQKLRADPTLPPYAREKAIESRITGPLGEKKHYAFLDGGGRQVELDIPLAPPRGQMASFGNLPPQHVWFEFRAIDNIGYVRLTEFLDLPRVLPAFGKAMQDCAKCEGIIIDLRGNPGGIGGMAMGMAGWLTERSDQRLGTMYMRGATLNFVINPRAQAFTGPVAILVDETSASTSEIFAGGLQDLHRARIFGTKTAGAALPSVITRLPNGDGFQYAVANYVSEGGRTLEGNGVTPDVIVELTRDGLLAGHDAVIAAALDWIRQQGTKP